MLHTALRLVPGRRARVRTALYALASGLALSLALRAAAAQAGRQNPETRPRACSFDAQCEHAMFDLNRYYRRLHAKLPSRSRPVLSRAERAWTAYRDATVPLMDARSQVDIVGARVAQLKRMGDTAGND